MWCDSPEMWFDEGLSATDNTSQSHSLLLSLFKTIGLLVFFYGTVEKITGNTALNLYHT